MNRTVDYKRLGEVTGKAWRLGHLQANNEVRCKAILDAISKMKVPSGQSQVNFHRGFNNGVIAVDKNRV